MFIEDHATLFAKLARWHLWLSLHDMPQGPLHSFGRKQPLVGLLRLAMHALWNAEQLDPLVLHYQSLSAPPRHQSEVRASAR